MAHPSLVRRDAELARILPRLSRVRELAIDCEFHTEGRYHPLLCVVQLGFASEEGEELWALSARELDLRPLGPVLADEAVTKLLHDGRQDLPILARATGIDAVRGVLDSQIAAAFCGLGGSVGYAALVQSIVGVELDKSLQVSDWTGELSDAQVEYALDDVRYLPEVVAELRARLTQSGRTGWVRAACDEATARALRRPDRDLLYRKVASTSRLGPEQLGILREVARWRDEAAEATDKPPVMVANDLALKSLAYQPPRSTSALSGIRGLGSGRAQPWAGRLIEAVARGIARPEMVARRASRHDPAVVEGLTSLLGLARRHVAARETIAAEVLADQAELRELVEWHLDGRPEADDVAHDVLLGWRRDVLGALLLEALDGAVTFRADGASAAGIEVSRPPPRE